VIYVFDIDGTLTPHRQQATDDFVEFFMKWGKDKKYYLTTGSDFEKVKEQLPRPIWADAVATFCCMGNQCYVKERLIYENNFLPSKELIEALSAAIESSAFPLRLGNHLELRTGMLNFSVMGRNADTAQREIYYEHDKVARERETLVLQFKEQFKDLDFAIGGKISIDIYPCGRDKSQTINWIIENETPQPIVYFGDRLEEGGNDYSAVVEMQKYQDTSWHNVSNWRETMEILKNFDLVKNKDAL
jgi:phosphomannomutase